MLPFQTAKKLPIYFYGSVKFASLKGSVLIDAPIKRGMIGFGQAYEMITKFSGTSELDLKGKLIFKGYMQFGKDFFIHIAPNAICELGDMSSLASKGKLICTQSIKLGNYARFGSECQIFDTNFHQLKNTISGKIYSKSGIIKIGSYNFIGNRVSVMSKTITSDNCIVASNSLCNKNYTQLGSNILIGGIPAKLLKENISRDWEGESELMDKYLKKRLI